MERKQRVSRAGNPKITQLEPTALASPRPKPTPHTQSCTARSSTAGGAGSFLGTFPLDYGRQLKIPPAPLQRGLRLCEGDAVALLTLLHVTNYYADLLVEIWSWRLNGAAL